VALDEATAAALQDVIDRIRSRGAIPGLSVAVVFPDGAIWTGQSGTAVLSSGEKVTADTLFSIGSITKTYTGALALRLEQRGVVAFDDPVSRYLPDYPNGSKITIRMLLNHTSGIRDLFEAAVFKPIDADHSARWTPEEALALVGKPYFAPGRNYHYSSTNYIVLGEVLEAATGRTMRDLVHAELLEPLGLTSTFLQWQEDPAGPLAHGYAGPAATPRDLTNGYALLPYVSEATAVGAGGGMAATASDVARWAAALYGGGILDPASMTSMTDVSPSKPYKPSFNYGMSFQQLPIAGRVAWGHRGHLDGFWSAVACFPNSGVTIAILTNADWINPLISLGSIYTAIPGAA
jgi:D-alanyl-D-alanine carboxypeptidase